MSMYPGREVWIRDAEVWLVDAEMTLDAIDSELTYRRQTLEHYKRRVELSQRGITMLDMRRPVVERQITIVRANLATLLERARKEDENDDKPAVTEA